MDYESLVEAKDLIFVMYLAAGGEAAKFNREYEEMLVASRENSGTGKLTIIDGGEYSASEIDAAHYMADLGNDVVLRPPVGTRANGQTSDLLVNGINYDVYTPITTNPSSIIRAITKKNTQTVGVVLDLSKTTVTVDDLGNILARVKGAIEKTGGTCNIKDIVVMPK